MEDHFGPDFITVTDEDGNDFELELVDTLEHQGVTYKKDHGESTAVDSLGNHLF